VLCAVIVTLGSGIEWLDPFPEDRYQVQLSAETLPSTRAVSPRSVAEGMEVLSVVVHDDALHDPEGGLLTHPGARGRLWERPGYASYFTDGRLRLASSAGLRIHGGRSRRYSPVKSFRLYFRQKYGLPAVPADLLFGEGPANNLTSVIAHNDVRKDRKGREWHLVNPLAYDIARRLGGITPRARPMQFYLNGEKQGVYVLTERINDEFFEARFGHADFDINSGRSRTQLRRWLRTTKPFTMERVGAVVDLPNLTSWALTVLFCATTDVLPLRQSPLVRDLRDPAARWFWVTWDLDHSFMDVYLGAPQPWLLDTYARLLSRSEPRSQILTRLLRTPDFSRYFSDRLSAALNHQLTPEFLEERFGFYREAALRRGVADTRYLTVLDTFLKERPQVLWDLTTKHLKTEDPVAVAVTGQPGTTVMIDGFSATLPYTGKYFPGASFVLDGGSAAWIVNGRLHRGQRVSFEVKEPVVIAPAHTAEQSPR
jgi:hypothetical protein